MSNVVIRSRVFGVQCLSCSDVVLPDGAVDQNPCRCHANTGGKTGFAIVGGGLNAKLVGDVNKIHWVFGDFYVTDDDNRLLLYTEYTND